MKRYKHFIKWAIQTGIFFIMIYSASSFKLFAVGGVGLGGYMNLGYLPLSSSKDSIDLVKVNFGASFGIVTPYWINMVFSVGGGIMDGRSALFSQMVVNYTLMFNKYAGFTTGVGMGLDMPYGTPLSPFRKKPNEASYIGLAVRSHMPTGFKFFPTDSLEFFVVVTFNLGSLYNWNREYISEGIEGYFVSDYIRTRRFYGGIGGQIGVQYWF